MAFVKQGQAVSMGLGSVAEGCCGAAGCRAGVLSSEAWREAAKGPLVGGPFWECSGGASVGWDGVRLLDRDGSVGGEESAGCRVGDGDEVMGSGGDVDGAVELERLGGGGVVGGEDGDVIDAGADGGDVASLGDGAGTEGDGGGIGGRRP